MAQKGTATLQACSRSTIELGWQHAPLLRLCDTLQASRRYPGNVMRHAARHDREALTMAGDERIRPLTVAGQGVLTPDGLLRATVGKARKTTGRKLVGKFYPGSQDIPIKGSWSQFWRMDGRVFVQKFYHRLESSMLRSERARNKRGKDWTFSARVDAKLKPGIVAMAAERGGTISDEIELAIRAHLKTKVPEKEPPRKLGVFDKTMVRMRHHNGMSKVALAKEFGLTVHEVDVLCK